MNAERLLAHYERISDAPDAIARLRRFILELAVRGKLVVQDDNASAVGNVKLEIITKRRGQMRDSIEPPFDLPTGWAWRAIDTIADQVTDGEHATPPRISEHQIPLVTAKNVREGTMDYGNTDWVSASTAEKAWSRCRPAVGDLLMVCVGATTGRLTVLREPKDMVLVRSVALIRPNKSVEAEYLERAIRSPILQQQIWASVKISAQPCLYINKIQSLLIPLPPLTEQRRIVAKVDELMALCDRLEAARAAREATRDRLTTSTLARLNTPDPATFQAAARFALNTIPALTTRPDQIKQLRQTILNLAVRGKLVPQNPEDGTGAEMIKSIRKARITWEAAGRIRKEKDSCAAVLDAEKYLELPTSWKWARLIELGQTQTGTSPSSTNPDLFGDFIPFIKPSDLDGNEINYGGPGLSEAGKGHSRLVSANSVMMVCIGATLGKVNTTTRPVCFNQQINSLTPFVAGMTDFIALALKASGFQALAWSKAGIGTLPIISKGKWEILPIPLPPLAEQYRIVAKVDALMKICDQLEVSLDHTATTRRRLLAALLAEALMSSKIRELEAAE